MANSSQAGLFKLEPFEAKAAPEPLTLPLCAVSCGCGKTCACDSGCACSCGCGCA
jgi:hypothetical protein